MPLRFQLESQHETISDFLLAADQKCLEGLELMVAGRYGSGIYLMGYAAEMLLKAACFRFDGARLSDPVRPLLPPTRAWQQRFFPTIEHESYHSLRYWCCLLRTKHRRWGRHLTTGIDQELVRRARRLYSIWWAEMRYRPDRAGATEAQIVYNDTTWIRDQYAYLWR